MKRFLLFICLCLFALNALAQQQKSLPVVQYPSEILQPPRIVVRMPSVTRLTFGRIYYGAGYGRNVIFWRPPVIYMQPLRILSLPMSASDSLFRVMLRRHKQGWTRGENTGKSFLRDYEKFATAPQIFVLPPHQMYGNRLKPDTLIYLPHLQE